MSDPLAVVAIILATCGISIWGFQNPEVEERLIFRPERILAGKEYYRLVSSAFLHAGWTHLLLNVYTLYAFGMPVAVWLGDGHFLIIYFSSVIGGNLLSLYLHRNHDYAAYGASGGVCGIIFAYVLRFPESRMMLFPIPYAVPGWIYALAFVIASFYAMKAQKDNIGHDAHLGGAIIGLLVTAQLHPDLVAGNRMRFTLILLASGLILAYLVFNPLFLPLAAFFDKPTRTRWRFRPSLKSAPVPAKGLRARAPRVAFTEPETDWLLGEIQDHVGKLEKDQSGAHAWIDKFGRTYDLVVGRPESFELKSFTSEVLDHLNRPKVAFVVVDTRPLREDQVNLVRPFFADLPDAQFNRVIRSYSFDPR